ncbi:sigma 54-interacting transcriptional regulator [Verrucomicrobiota bacterium]
MARKKSIDPVVAAFVASDKELSAVLRNPAIVRTPVVEALALLSDFINGKSANGALLAARDVSLKGIDAGLCILFLAHWAQALFIQSGVIRDRLQEAWTLVHQANNLASPGSPPELLSLVRLVESKLVAADGDTARQEETVRESLSALAADSPRRKFAVLELASLLARSGRMADMGADLETLAAGRLSPAETLRLTGLQFMDSVETGRTNAAVRLLPQLTDGPGGASPGIGVERYKSLLDLMNVDGPELPEDGEPVARGGEPDWALTVRCLMSGRVHQALRWARLWERNHDDCISGQGFVPFNLVRAELAEGNAEAARRLIEMRNTRGNTHYFDAFFLARAELLAGHGEDAASLLASVLDAVHKYSAGGRLDFELRLAVEMRRDVLLHIARDADAIRMSQAARRSVAAAAPTPEAGPAGLQRIIGTSSALDSVRKTTLQFANLDVPVLITGETGTGKELVARAIHETGVRAREPFVATNCGAISESLLESELFGHEKGAFTGAASAHRGLFEEAGAGTILLDEIGEISPRLQVALLRVLETDEIRPVGSSRSRKIKCRILASTNADLDSLAADNRFRRDILFRLRRLEIDLPPLRERVDDVLPLAAHFLDLDRPAGIHAMMSARLQNMLRAYGWPGNVRELRNALEKMRLMNSDKLYYDEDDLDSAALQDTHAQPRPDTGPPAEPAPLPAVSVPEADEPMLFRRGKSRARRLELLRSLFLQHQILTRSEIVKTFRVSPNTATSDLKALCEEGMIERVKPSKSPRSVYFRLRSDEAERT